MFRLSSTPLNSYLQCPRRWFFSQIAPQVLDTDPINFGKLFHAAMEAAFLYFYEAPDAEALWHYVRKLDGGDYGGSEDLLENAGLCERVYKVFCEVMRHPEVRALFELDGLKVEVDISPLDVRMGNHQILCRGRMDLFYRDAQGMRVIWDWKTRANLAHAPFTDEEFRRSPQLAYYAAVLHHHSPEPQGVRVTHGNILRDTGRVAVYSTVFDAKYLEKMFRFFDRHLVPEMEQAYVAGMDHLGKVTADPTACFRMGKCPYYTRCPVEIQPADIDAIDTLWRENSMRVISKEAPPEETAVPVPMKAVNVLNGATVRIVSILQANGIFVLGDMKRFLEYNNLRGLPGIGPVLEQKLLASLDSYYKEYVAS
jgi:RecB family exonuclease